MISGMKSNTTGKIGYEEDKAPPKAAAVREDAGSYRYSVQDGDYVSHSYRLICDAPPHYDVGRPLSQTDPKPPSSATASDEWTSSGTEGQAAANRFFKPAIGQSINEIMEGVRGLTKPLTTQGGGPGYNEICMDDTAGKELMRMHAQYDKDATVNNDERSQVGNNLDRSVANNETVSIGNDETVVVANNSSESIGVNKVITAGTSITLKCGASLIHMNQAGVITISGSLITVAGTVNINVAAPITNVVGEALMTTTGAVNLVSGDVTRVFGSSLGHFEGGKAELIGNGSTLVKGPKVNVEGGDTVVKGGTVNVDGGKTSIVGAPVKIN